MPYYEFGQNDIFVNRIKSYPSFNFFIYGGEVFYQKESRIEGEHTGSARHIPTGHISLYELNVDIAQEGNGPIYPFLTKQGSLTSFKTISSTELNEDFLYGDVITGSYPLSASIQREYFATGSALNFSSDSDIGNAIPHITALRNTLDYYSPLSAHHKFENDTAVGTWNKEHDILGLISIPSIFYGSSIKKGSVELNFYVTGSLIGQLKDEKRNGELIEVSGSNTGEVAGVVLYNEGFIVLTGSWDIADGRHTENYVEGINSAPSWADFGAGAHEERSSPVTASSFELSYYGVNYTPVMTMFANAEKGEMNHSNNPTFINFNDASKVSNFLTASNSYVEHADIRIKNTVSGAYTDLTSSFEKQTYISKIGLYDEEKNLIAIAKLATPVKKTEERNLTFKLKLDI